MFIITFFPGIFAHLLTILGIVIFLGATILGMVPLISQYKIIAQFVSVIMLCFGLFLEGGIAYKEGIEKEVAELKLKLADAEIKANNKNTEIVEKIVTDTKVVKVKGDTVIKYIEKNANDIDKACVIPPEVIDAHNRAATLNVDASATTVDKPAEPAKAAPKVLLPPRTDKK